MIRTLIADDHAMLRLGLCEYLSGQPGIEVIGQAADGEEAQRQCVALHPDVLVLDVRMPGPPAIDTVRFVQSEAPNTGIVIFTAEADVGVTRRLAGLEVNGYVVKSEHPTELVQAIESAARSETWFSPRVLAALKRGWPTDREHEPDFTGREREILALIARGYGNQRVAAELLIAEQTAKNYIHALYRKVGVHTRAEAMLWAHEHGYGEA